MQTKTVDVQEAQTHLVELLSFTFPPIPTQMPFRAVCMREGAGRACMDDLVVGRCRRTLIASGSEDLQVEHPVCGGQSPAFHFHPTFARVQGPALIRDQVVQVRQAGEKRRLTPIRDGGSPSWRRACGRWRCALDPARCSSPASAGLRAPHTSLLFCPGTNGARARHALRPPSWRCDWQSDAGTGPLPPPVGFCAVDTGAAGRGTWSVTPGVPRLRRRPVCSGVC